MSKQIDENLNLEQLLARCKELDPYMPIRLYFDPTVFLFFISYVDEMDFFLSPDASLIAKCRADQVRAYIEMFIARAVRKFIEPVE